MSLLKKYEPVVKLELHSYFYFLHSRISLDLITEEYHDEKEVKKHRPES